MLTGLRALAALPLAALVLAAGCGTGTDGRPVTPPTTPAPEPTPTVRLAAWLVSEPSDDGYKVAEKIQVILDFQQPVTPEGSPRLAIEIGSHLRLADLVPDPENSNPSWLWFEYEVAPDDKDTDGISIAADALDLSEGVVRNAAGVEVEVVIHIVNAGRNSQAPYPAQPGEDLDRHRVVGTPEPPPTVRLAAWLVSEPSNDGYIVAEKIQVILDFQQPVTPEGSPRLAIEIGSHLRLADLTPEPEHPNPSWLWFEYEVAPDDEDTDGISIAADALDLSQGVVRNAAGVEVEVVIHTVNAGRNSQAPYPAQPGEDLDRHRVVGTPQPRVCTDEQQRARAYGAPLVDEWDGTPFRVDMIQNFPAPGTEADVAELLDSVRLAADKIERQLGYRVLEMGDVIPVPARMRPGWNEDNREFSRTCPLPREAGQIQGFYMDDLHPANERADAQAQLRCGDFSYLQPFMTYWPCRGCEDARTPGYGHYIDGVTLHEIFHLLGYIHTEEHERIARGEGVPMSWQLRNVRGPDAESLLWSDIDALGCVYPHPDFPR